MGVMKSINLGMALGRGGYARVTKAFFDRQQVIDRLGRADANALSKAGAFIRRTAKGKLRYAKGPSRPGNPPHVHRDVRMSSPLRDLLYFSYDEQTNSVVIGPAHFVGQAVVPRLLELGGTLGSRKNTRRTIRQVGDGGEVRIGGRVGRTTKISKQGAIVTYALLRTAAQAERANRLNEELYGPMQIGPATIAARPYMGPSLEENRPKLPGLWANSVT